MSNVKDPLSRRRALALGGGVAGGLIAAASPLRGAASGVSAAATRGGIDVTRNGPFPMQQIEAILGTTGMMMNGVLAIELDRTDLHVTGPGGLLWQPSFEVNHTFDFQPLGDGRAILNAEMSFLSAETNRAIDKILAGGLTLMAFHRMCQKSEFGRANRCWRGLKCSSPFQFGLLLALAPGRIIGGR